MSNSLVILWVNADQGASLNMVLMYAKNSILRGWWEEVELVIWGPTAKLVVEDPVIQAEVLATKLVGVHVSACQACARNYGVYDQLIDLGLDVKSYGPVLTQYLQEGIKKIITI